MLYPVEPPNINIYSPGTVTAYDLTWDDPSLTTDNQVFKLNGVNLYKAYDDPNGTYFKVNNSPVSIGYYRDQTVLTQVSEDVSGQFISIGDNPRKEWIFRVKNLPMVVNDPTNPYPTGGRDVNITVNGTTTYPLKVVGETGMVYMISSPYYDPRSEKNIPPVLPQPGSTVVCTYYYQSNIVSRALNRRIYYKLTTVGTDSQGNVLESPLSASTIINPDVMEQADPVWEEAVNRNAFLLEQGGERVKIFLRKWSGTICPEYSISHKQAINDCKICFGTGYIGGYDGPYDALTAPPDAGRSLEATDMGLKPQFSYDTWTGPFPPISQRDFMVRKNGERLSIGEVSLTMVSGAPLQQSFTASLIQAKDIRYFVPIDGKLVIPVNANPSPSDPPPNPDQIAARKKVWEDIF